MDEATKQALLEELKKEYDVEIKPKKILPVSINDILQEYYPKIFDKVDIFPSYTYQQTVANAIRKIMCIRYGVWGIKEIDKEKEEKFREETEKFIKDFMIGGKEL